MIFPCGSVPESMVWDMFFVIGVLGPKTITPAVRFRKPFLTLFSLAVQHRNRWFGTVVCDLCAGAQNNHSGGQIPETFLLDIVATTRLGFGHIRPQMHARPKNEFEISDLEFIRAPQNM